MHRYIIHNGGSNWFQLLFASTDVVLMVGFILEMETPYPELAGVVLVCSVPPSGNRWFSLL